MEIFSFTKDKRFENKQKDCIKKCAVILIDMQERFVKNLRDGEANRIIPKQLEVLNYCNQVGIPVIVLELKQWEYGKTIDVLMVEARKNSKFHLISKQCDDGFYGTNLHSCLRNLGVKRVFIMGINADFCVMETARSAIDNGYKIITSNEVISGQSHHRSDNSLGWFTSNGDCFDRVNEFMEVTELT